MTLFISAFAVTTGNTMTKPEYYNQSKPKEKEEVLTERKCNICGKKAKMGKFERYCSIQCRNRATELDTTAHGIRF
jgi:hypothetical protein|tara:strand:+ start:351 stop:578 length:228 start_codon:yes stop_codon:yes gene_type:complete